MAVPTGRTCYVGRRFNLKYIKQPKDVMEKSKVSRSNKNIFLIHMRSQRDSSNGTCLFIDGNGKIVNDAVKAEVLN